MGKYLSSYNLVSNSLQSFGVNFSHDGCLSHCVQFVTEEADVH